MTQHSDLHHLPFTQDGSGAALDISSDGRWLAAAERGSGLVRVYPIPEPLERGLGGGAEGEEEEEEEDEGVYDAHVTMLHSEALCFSPFNPTRQHTVVATFDQDANEIHVWDIESRKVLRSTCSGRLVLRRAH